MKGFGKCDRSERGATDADKKYGKPLPCRDVLQVSPVEEKNGDSDEAGDDMLAENNEIRTESLRKVGAERCIRRPKCRCHENERGPPKSDIPKLWHVARILPH